VLVVTWFFLPGSTPVIRGESLNREPGILLPDAEHPPVRSVDGGHV
jgi:hypothetical protein